MNWRTAFLDQARSDYEMMRLLNEHRVASCHQFHYLQMATEKLAKSFLLSANANTPPRTTHLALVRFLRVLKAQWPHIGESLGYRHRESFGQLIDSLLPVAEEIERLAPNFAGTSKPNPEYPWQIPGNSQVTAPAQFDFETIEAFNPKNPQLGKLLKLLESLLNLS